MLLNVIRKITTIIIIFIYPHNTFSQEIPTDYYLKGIEYLQAGDTLLAENQFRQSVREYSDASSYFELGEIFRRKSKIDDKLAAKNYFIEAIEIEPNNANYRFELAHLYEELAKLDPLDIFSKGNAISEYKNIIEIDSQYVSAYYRLGYIYSESFLEFNDSYMQEPVNLKFNSFDKSPSNRFKYSVGKMNEEFKGQLDYERPNQEDFELAEHYLKGCLHLVPNNYEVLIMLVGLYEDVSEFKKGIELLQKFLRDNPSYMEVYLYLGLLNYSNSEIENSYEAFRHALKLMSPKEKKDFTVNSVVRILSPVISNIRELSHPDIELLIDNFWKSRDPLALSDFNERLIEHYFRVAYANIRFDVPKLKIPGWETDRGDIFLRYGKPNFMKRLRPSVSIPESGLFGSGLEANAKTEIWTYDDFTVVFADKFMNNNYTLSRSQVGMNVTQSIENSDDFMFYKKKEQPENYIPKFEGPIFEVAYYTARYKNNKNNTTDVFINYAIELIDSIPVSEQINQTYKVGLFFFDKYFNKKSERQEIIEQLDFSENEKMSVHSISMTTEPDSGNLAFEMIREYDKGVASYHGKFKVKDFHSDELQISDIIAATAVELKDDANYPVKRGEYTILPNPTKRFNKETPLLIYYEIYNLMKNENRLTDFEQEITIRQKDDDGSVLDDLLDVIGFDSEGRKVTMKSEYQTAEKDPKLYLQLDMSDYEPGEYIVQINITDKAVDKNASNNCVIFWE